MATMAVLTSSLGSLQLAGSGSRSGPGSGLGLGQHRKELLGSQFAAQNGASVKFVARTGGTPFRVSSSSTSPSSASSISSSCCGIRRREALTTRASSASASSSSTADTVEDERLDLAAYVKSVLPGGFAAARLWGTGRRKTAVARVVLVDGTGKIIINNRNANDYLQGNPLWLQAVKYPLASLGYEAKYDTIVRAHGGGLSGQAQAILLGISRALIVANQANRAPLKKQGLLTRDSRVVERKKYGLKKARKAPQFSKR